MQGRWMTEIVWITDWPGFGKKGDTVTGYAEWQVALNGNVINEISNDSSLTDQSRESLVTEFATYQYLVS